MFTSHFCIPMRNNINAVTMLVLLYLMEIMTFAFRYNNRLINKCYSSTEKKNSTHALVQQSASQCLNELARVFT